MGDEVELFRKLQKLFNKAVGYYEVGDAERCSCTLGIMFSVIDTLGESISPEGPSSWTHMQIQAFMDQVVAEVNSEP